MKNFFLLCAMLCASACIFISNIYAQDVKPRFGIKAGIDLMTLGSVTADDGTKFNYGNRTGIQAGIYADLPLASKLSFMPEVLYSQKGGNISNSLLTASSYTLVVQSKINYLEVPLLVAFKPQPNFSISAGPQVAFLLSQESYLNVFNGDNSASDNSNATNHLRKISIGGNIGVGYLFTNKVGLNLHYSIDFQHAGTDATSGNTGERNSGFALTVSYLF